MLYYMRTYIWNEKEKRNKKQHCAKLKKNTSTSTFLKYCLVI